MADKLYRKSSDGSFESAVPEARGKAAALDAWLAQGGTPFRNSGRYAKGPFKGKNYDEAKAQFENMWAKAPDALKEKYASRSQKTDLAPSERAPIDRPSTNASSNATRPGETSAQAADRFRAGRTPAPQTSTAQRPAPGNSFQELTTPPVKAPGATAQSVGDGSSAETRWKPKKAFDEERARLLAEAAANPPTPKQRSEPDTYVPDVKPAETPPPVAGPAQTLPNSGTGGLFPRSFPNDMGAKQAVNDRAVQEKNAQYQQEAAAQHAKDLAEVNASRAAVGMPTVGQKSAPAPAPTIAPTQPMAPAPVDGQPPIPSPSGTRPPTAAEGNNSPELLKSNPEYGKIADERMAPGGLAASTPSPTRGRPEPTRSAIVGNPDFTPGPSKELTGMSAGRPTYSSADSLYGKAKGDIDATIARTPATADPKKPVMIQGQSMDERRASFQSSQARPAAPIAGPRPMPRGPASQPVATGSSVAPIAPPRVNDPDILKKDDAAAAAYQANFGNDSTDQQFDDTKNAQKKLYDGASSQDQAKLAANTMRRAGKLNQTFSNEVANAQRASVPGNTRVVARRPMTAEENRTGKVITAPPVRRPMLAR